MRPVLLPLFTIALIGGVAVVASIAGRAAWNSATAEPQSDVGTFPPLQVFSDEARKPKFEGEVLGVYIGRSGTPDDEVPDKFVTVTDLCGSKPGQQVSWEDAGPFDLSVHLPAPFSLIEDSLNTGVTACGNEVIAARWDYSYPQGGETGNLIIARSSIRYTTFDVSADRIEEIALEGLPAVHIKPLSPNGVGSTGGVIIPGDSVTTMISAFGIPDETLLAVAELVAVQIKTVE